MPDDNKHLDMLLQALQLLAAPYEQQMKALPSFVHLPDEIALIFDEVYGFVDELAEKNLITDPQQANLKQIDTLLEEMSKNKDLWAFKSLEASVQWEDVRLLVKGILVSFHETEQFPNLFWIQYIKDDKGNA